jgi:carbon monoxide dehydrogenase subunit G
MRPYVIIFLSLAAVAAVTLGGVAAARVADDDEQQMTLPAEIGDVSAATAVEVRDAAGRVVLQGTLAGTADASGEIERKAKLAAGDGSSASGEAEIEVVRSKATGAMEVEVDLDVAGLAAATTYTFHLDGRQAASFTTDAKGKAEIELAPAAGK